MKRPFAAFLLLLTPVLPAAAQNLNTEAQRAYMAGDLATAKQKFRLILATDPQNVAARNYLKMIAVTEAQAGPGERMGSTLQKLVLPKVEFSGATLDSALEALRQQAAKASAGKVAISFVMQPKVDPSTPITLHLAGIPFMEALRYIGTLANVDFVVERYAILVQPKAVTGAPGQ